MEQVVKADNLSKWYGNVLGISEISLNLGGGIFGILGPNGAGKSTLLKILIGQLKPNIGSAKLFGEESFSNENLFKKTGYCPEFDTFYRGTSAYSFLCFKAKLHGFMGKNSGKMAKKALAKVGLEKEGDRLITEYSMGMRQRLKLASSIIHEPQLLILDEPLRGVDPLWRINIIRMLKNLGKEGKTVIVSSHILSEVESLTNSVIMIHQGKIFAQGDIQELRNMIDSHPHKISIECNSPRRLAKEMISDGFVKNVAFVDSENRVTIETDNRDNFFTRLMEAIVKTGIEIKEITSPDDNLQAVFDYLIGS